MATAGKDKAKQVPHVRLVMLAFNITPLKSNLEILKESLNFIIMLHASIQVFHIWKSNPRK